MSLAVAHRTATGRALVLEFARREKGLDGTLAVFTGHFLLLGQANDSSFRTLIDGLEPNRGAFVAHDRTLRSGTGVLFLAEYRSVNEGKRKRCHSYFSYRVFHFLFNVISICWAQRVVFLV